MNEFVTWEALGSYAGAVMMVTLITQLLKGTPLGRWNSQLVAYLMAAALLVGAEAARAALAGENGVMVGLRRLPGAVYKVETFLIPVEQVMLHERKMPDEYISADGCDVTDAFVEWCRPLIGGELRRFVSFKPNL